MWRASESHEYERAARYRDLLRALEELARGQNVEIAGSGSVDVVGVEGDGRDASIVVLIYRDGKLVDKREFHWEGLDAPADASFLGAFLGQFYEANPAVPERVEVPFEPEEADVLVGFLKQQRGAAVKLLEPRRGQRARVLALAQENAREAFRLRFRHPRREAERVGEEIASVLGLPRPAARVECFDISHLQGEAQVASLVVWERGRMRKGEYRSFNVRAGEGADDPAAVAEAVGAPLSSEARRGRAAAGSRTDRRRAHPARRGHPRAFIGRVRAAGRRARQAHRGDLPSRPLSAAAAGAQPPRAPAAAAGAR